MLGIQLGIAAASIMLFSILLYIWPLKTSSSKRTVPRALWGGLFAAMYYYGLPVWWWRYGLRNALKLVLTCVASTAFLNVTLRMAGWLKAEDVVESLINSMFLAIPIRALAGFWLVRNDERWATSIAAKRRLKSETASKEA
jgi:hypothetical protein